MPNVEMIAAYLKNHPKAKVGSAATLLPTVHSNSTNASLQPAPNQ